MKQRSTVPGTQFLSLSALWEGSFYSLSLLWVEDGKCRDDLKRKDTSEFFTSFLLRNAEIKLTIH